MSISQYAIGGLVLTTALAVGWAKWNDLGAKVKTSKAETAIARAECSTNAAVDTTEALNQQVATMAREVEEQKVVIRGLTKKADDRLRENNELRRKINNATDNPPIPDAAEFALDRLRGAIPGTSGTDRAHENGTEGEAGDLGGPLPPAAEPAS